MWLTGDRLAFDTDNAPEWLEDICRDNMTGPLYRQLQQDVDMWLFKSLYIGSTDLVSACISD